MLSDIVILYLSILLKIRDIHYFFDSLMISGL